MTERPADPAVRRFWDREAGSYDSAHDDREGGRSNPLWIRMDLVLRLLEDRSGSALDCGMGPGRLLVELEHRGWSVSGVDLSAEMVARARARLPASADRLVQGTAEALPFDSQTFDAVVATGVLEYVDDVRRALAEVARVLRPGGLFVVSMPNTRALGTIWRHRVVYGIVRGVKSRAAFGRPGPLPRPGLLARERLEALLEAAGLEVERVEYITLARVPFRAAVERRLGGQLVVAARRRG